MVTTNFKDPDWRRKRRKARDERPGMSMKHRRLVASLPSCVSGRSPCQAHHLRIKEERGVGMKATDQWCVPLTSDEHLGRDGVHSVGSREEEAWFAARGVTNVKGLAKQLWAATGDVARMKIVIMFEGGFYDHRKV